MRVAVPAHIVVALLAALLLESCASPPNSISPSLPFSVPHEVRPAPNSLQKPALVTFDYNTAGLAYWQIQHDGSMTLQSLSGSLGLSDVYSMAADGDTVIIANPSPAEVVKYDIDTQSETAMSDPYGNPRDVAVDRHGNIYALNTTSVTVYKPGSSAPSELTCSQLSDGLEMAVNNEGAVFVDGYGSGSFAGVVEFGSGSTKCKVLHLRTTRGYIGGVGVDPKTDDLIVIDDPSFCAGGGARMVIYPKPYEQRTSREHTLSATYCAASFRLSADSTRIFYADASVSDAIPIIDQARYPSGKYEGQYWLGYYSSVYFSGFTTIPNTLPN